MHENEDVPGRRGLHLLLQSPQKGVLRQRHDLVEEHIAAAQLGDVEYIVGPAGLRLEVRFLVQLGDRHVEIAVLQVATRLAVEQRGLDLARGSPIRAVEHAYGRKTLILFVPVLCGHVSREGQGAPVDRGRRLHLRFDACGSLRIAGCPEYVPQSAQRRQNVLMTIAVRLALDAQDALFQRRGVAVLLVLEPQIGEGRQGRHEVRIIVAQRGLLQSQRATVVLHRLIVPAGLCRVVPQAAQQPDEILRAAGLGQLQRPIALIEGLLHPVGRFGGLERLGGAQQVGGLSRRESREQRENGNQQGEQGARKGSPPQAQIPRAQTPQEAGRGRALVPGRNVTGRRRHGARVRPAVGASSFLYAGGVCTVPEEPPVREASIPVRRPCVPQPRCTMNPKRPAAPAASSRNASSPKGVLKTGIAAGFVRSICEVHRVTVKMSHS